MADGSYGDFVFGKNLPAGEVEISEGVVLLKKDDADKYLASKSTVPASIPASAGIEPTGSTDPVGITPSPGETVVSKTNEDSPTQGELFTSIEWNGEVPPAEVDEFLHEGRLEV